MIWDPYLQFGRRNGPEVAHCFTSAILAILRSWAFSDILGIMDDFLVIVKTQEPCQAAWQAQVDLLGQLGQLGFEVN